MSYKNVIQFCFGLLCLCLVNNSFGQEKSCYVFMLGTSPNYLGEEAYEITLDRESAKKQLTEEIQFTALDHCTAVKNVSSSKVKIDYKTQEQLIDWDHFQLFREDEGIMERLLFNAASIEFVEITLNLADGSTAQLPNVKIALTE